MNVKGLLIILSFVLISFAAKSQTAAEQTPAARQEIIDWLNQKFDAYKKKNPDFPGKPISSVKFEGCTMQANSVYVQSDNKFENATIDIGTITSIDFLDMHGGMILIKTTSDAVFIAFAIHKEPDLLTRMKSSIDYLKINCANN